MNYLRWEEHDKKSTKPHHRKRKNARYKTKKSIKPQKSFKKKETKATRSDKKHSASEQR